MKKNILILVTIVSTTVFFSCNSEEKKHEFTASEKELVQEYYEAKDSNVVNAYLDDKSTISSEDIPKDTTISARTKTLYTGTGNNEKLAIVRGFKAKEGELGMAIYQIDTKEPVTLQEVKSADSKVAEFVTKDGKIKLQISGDFAFVQQNGGSVQYERIK